MYRDLVIQYLFVYSVVDGGGDIESESLSSL